MARSRNSRHHHCRDHCRGHTAEPGRFRRPLNVHSVAEGIAKRMTNYIVVVEKSTVPVQTGEDVEETIRKNNANGVPFDVVSNPEFLREGTAVYDFLHPDRIVIGVKTKRAERVMRN